MGRHFSRLLTTKVLTSSASPLHLIALEVSLVLKHLYKGHLVFTVERICPNKYLWPGAGGNVSCCFLADLID